MFFYFVVFAAIAQSFRNHLSVPGTEMTQPLCVTLLCVCVCAFTLRFAISLLPQPPVTDRQ